MKKILSHFSLFIVLLLFAAIFITCRKEYSYEGGPKKNAAVYTLAGSAGACTGAVLAGNYYMGKVLTAANTVQLQVDVTTAGSYTVSTNTADGFQFSGSGNFTNTGIQTILLTASGTATATGSIAFTATAINTGCTFSVSVISEPVVMASFAIDCQSLAVNGRCLAGTKLTIGNTVTFNINVTAVGAYTISTDTLDGIYFIASGNFSSTGSKAVSLIGYGTPEFARNLDFKLHGAANNCPFTVTVTNADPLAVYVLESGYGNPNPCIYTLAGNYTKNTALNASNSVTVSVYASTTGNFTISTSLVNGFMFAHSGEFTVVGTQTVTLQGIGTPLASGVYSLAPEIVGPHPLGGQFCGISVTVQ